MLNDPRHGHGKKGAPEAEGGSFAEREQARRDADAERKRRKRAEEKAVQEANGTLRKRGRPRKNVSGSGLPSTP